MSVEKTIEALSQFCKQNSNDTQLWQGKSGSYQWTVGKVTGLGILNGVVRKLAGVDVSGKQIWVVAGSFKIDQAGNILRFTGLSRKDQVLIARMAEITTQAHQVHAETVTA